LTLFLSNFPGNPSPTYTIVTETLHDHLKFPNHLHSKYHSCPSPERAPGNGDRPYLYPATIWLSKGQLIYTVQWKDETMRRKGT
jgi:hypothetical protein